MNKSIIVGRWDPKYINFYKELSNSAQNVVKLRDLLRSSPQYGLAESGIPRISPSQPRYIRITDIDSNGFLSEDNQVTCENITDNFYLEKNDLLFARSGATVGKCYIHKQDKKKGLFTFAGYLIRFQVDLNKVLPDYIFVYSQLSVFKKWVNAIQRISAQPNINASEYGDLSVILPEMTIQDKIVDLFKISNDIRNKQLAKRISLLASTDSYLLNQLGIQKTEKNISAESRIFLTSFGKVIGKRFDPIYYNSDLKQFNKGKFTSFKLKTLIRDFSSGQGVGRQDQVTEEEGILQIRPTNLGKRGSFLFQKNVFIPDEARHKRLQKGDVIFNNTNSQELVGKSAYWDLDVEAAYSNHITVLRVNETKIFPEYLALILNLYQKSNIFYSICTNWNNQSGVGIDVLLDLNIPLPPLIIQEEIISHIRQIRDEAAKLEYEANIVLENAKQEIEKIILGGTA